MVIHHYLFSTATRKSCKKMNMGPGDGGTFGAMKMPLQFIRSKHNDPAFKGYMDIGKLRLGWVIQTDRAKESILLKEWPYATRHNTSAGVRIPFPVLTTEWEDLQKVFFKAGILIPEQEKIVGQRSVENADIRFELSHAKHEVPDYEINGINGTLFPFQNSGVAYAETMAWRALIGDDMGLGKTIQGIACALKSEAKRTVVVTRAVAVPGWHRAIRRFTDKAVRVGFGASEMELLKSGRLPKIGLGDHPEDYVPFGAKPGKLKEGEVRKYDPELALAGIDVNTRGMGDGFLVIHYDVLSAWAPHITAWGADMLILDEAHAIKEPSSKRSQIAHQMMQDTEKVICLSGTPIPNRPKEFFHVEENLHPGKWGDWYKFAHRYCDAKMVTIGYDWRVTGRKFPCHCGGRQKGCKRCHGSGQALEKIREEKKAWDFDGASNEKEMYRRMRGFGMVRRLKDDVLGMMPAQQETILLEQTKRYRDVEHGFMSVMNGEFNPLEKKADEASMHKLFEAAAADKIDWAKTWITDFLEDTEEKLVIFFHHNVVGEALSEWLKEAEVPFVSAYGTKSDKNVEQAFQGDDKKRVILCSYGVAREAVTLTSSSYMLCLEYSWVPGWMQQAMDRIRRMGQERPCNYYFPVFRNSVEERIVNAFMGKQDVLSVIMQGEVQRSVEIEM